MQPCRGVGWSSYQHITPVAKSSTIDIRNPLQYKVSLFSFVLNQRLTQWAEMNTSLSDSPNGFRKGQSTVDHLKSVTSIIETRESARHSTFIACTDFQKAYDVIDRRYPFYKIFNIDVWMVNY